MRALCRQAYGLPDVLEPWDIDRPVLTDESVLVRVRASSVSPGEWYAVMGRPHVARMAMGLLKPKLEVPGADFAGTVEAVGTGVKRFRPGDEVFGGKKGGAFAEYVCVREEQALV